MEHDSNEFLLYLFNQLKDELTEKGTKLPEVKEALPKLPVLWKEYSKKFPSEIDRLFTIIERTLIYCSSCRKETTSL
jgi:hypothetical protein